MVQKLFNDDAEIAFMYHENWVPVSEHSRICVICHEPVDNYTLFNIVKSGMGFVDKEIIFHRDCALSQDAQKVVLVAHTFK